MQQQQQQPADYDLLAVFPDETKADEVATKLQKAGFTQSEVHQLAAGSIGSGQFREHGPNAGRREFFLQTQRKGPNPITVVLCAVLLGVILTAISFATTFALPTLHEPITSLVAALIGIVLGAIFGLTRRGRVRGAIGQSAPPTPAPPPTPGARTLIALRLADSENISRKSRARAILLNNQGKIDRSVGRKG